MLLSAHIKTILYIIISSFTIVVSLTMSMISAYNQIGWLVFIYLLLMVMNVVAVGIVETD